MSRSGYLVAFVVVVILVFAVWLGKHVSSSTQMKAMDRHQGQIQKQILEMDR